jgi:hypothetical protein
MCGSKTIEESPSMEERLAIVPASCVFENVAAVVLNSVRADTSRRVYHHALIEFLAWHAARGCHALNKAIVQEYRADLDRRRLASSSINLRMSVIRKLAVSGGIKRDQFRRTKWEPVWAVMVPTHTTARAA